MTMVSKKGRQNRTAPCGCYAGILVMNENEIQRCDWCALFESDEDAAGAVTELLKLLHTVYTDDRGMTVADALDQIETAVRP